MALITYYIQYIHLYNYIYYNVYFLRQFKLWVSVNTRLNKEFKNIKTDNI